MSFKVFNLQILHKFMKFIFIFVFLGLSACSNPDESALNNSTENKATTELPSVLQKLAVNGGGTLSAYIIIDGNFNNKKLMTIDGSGAGSASVSIPGLSLAPHTIEIRYEYTLEGNVYPVATATREIDLTSGSASLGFTSNDYEFDLFDSDNDGVNNAAELRAGTDPGAGSSDITAPVFTSGNTISVAENTKFTGYIATATDAENAEIHFSLSGGSDQSLFSINSSTGELSFNTPADYEFPADSDKNNTYVMGVIATDGVNPVVQIVTVSVTDVNDNAPVFTSGIAINVAENNILTGYKAEATDGDGDSVIFSLSGGADISAFSINSTSGVLSFNKAANFDVPDDSDNNNTYEVQITATDGINQTVQNVTIIVTGINNNAPVFSSGTAINVVENMTFTGYVASAADADGDAVSFSFSNGADQSSFVIDTNSGELHFKSPADYEKPSDTDQNNRYVVGIIASDGANSVVQIVTISVTNVNDNAPIFSSVTAISEPEGTLLTKYTAIATDADGDALSYSLSGGLDAALFTIDSSSGALRFNTAPDFKSPADSGSNNIYDIEISVTDGSNSVIRNVTITVTDVNENTPVFTSGSVVSSAENTTVTGYVAIASDADGDTISYSIIGGADRALFSINSSSGELFFINAVDFELPLDADGANDYELEISASDGNSSVAQALVINVTNVNDNIPVFDSGSAVSMVENNSATGYIAVATDADGDALSYSLTGGIDQQWFTVNSSSGVLNFINSADFEMPQDSDADNVYLVEISVTDGSNSVVKSVAVSVTNIDETVPVVSLSIDNQTIAESGGIAIVSATMTETTAQDVVVTLGYSGSAIPVTDYTQAVSITILAGRLTGTARVIAKDDSLNELSESIIINISAITAGVIADTVTTRTSILDDDPLPEVTLSLDPQAEILENSGSVSVFANLSEISSRTVTVDLTYAGTARPAVDYIITTSITIPAGSLSAKIDITALPDSINELRETIIIDIVGVNNAKVPATLPPPLSISIADDDVSVVNFTNSVQTVSEGVGVVSLTVDLDIVSPVDVSVPFIVGGTALDGVDFFPDSYSITILAGQLSGTVNFTIQDDVLIEPEEVIEVTIVQPVNAVLGTTIQMHAVLISNNDYTVGGIVNGLTTNGLVLQNNLSDDLVITAVGDFVFSNALNGNSNYSVTVKTQPGGQYCAVYDAVGEAINNVTNITVDCFNNDAPVANNINIVIGEDIPADIIFTGSDFDNDTLTYRVINYPLSGFYDEVANKYIPNLDFVGTDSFTYVANDGAQDSVPATINITVTPAFTTTWETEIASTGSGSSQIKIGTNPEFFYNYSIAWGDGTVDENVSTEITHTYLNPGQYKVKISGIYPQPYFGKTQRNDTEFYDAKKLLTVDQWGSIEWLSMNSAFLNCSNMNINALDTPDLSQVFDMESMFEGATSFNQDISEWVVSNVVNMRSMFRNARAFNQWLDLWNVRMVVDMSSMFEGASSFNQPLNSWDVSSVIDMNSMFMDASSFNSDIRDWMPISVVNMSYMFAFSDTFNTPVGAWDVASVTDMSFMFMNAASFNNGFNNIEVILSNRDELNNWDTRSVVNMVGMFRGAFTFDQDIALWDVSFVRDMTDMFQNASAFSQSIRNWDVVSAISLSGMFDGAISFTADVSRWDVSSVTDMSYMFASGSGMSIRDYEDTLIAWSLLPSLQFNVVFDAGNSLLSIAAEDAKFTLTSQYGWTIIDGGPQ